ncbi:GNAT family N-acetyltransferase [Deinococcus altitudinis]|uniref:GNAT family N-acetyltransferase n=1 Tax=Deinococcus altitudinis TaxID=468914 RepID=UPI0038921827
MTAPDSPLDSSVPALRPYRPGDLLALYDVCLRTGDSGADASGLYRDPMLLGHYYAAPYATLCPDTTFVLDDGVRVQGYVLGVPDSQAFAARCEAEWFPVLRSLYPLPAESDTSRDARMVRAIHRGIPAPKSGWASRYPAHLHIDLLPVAQGGGHGRRLMQTLFAALAARGAAGVHLGVGLRNLNAQGFYLRLGFQELERGEASVTYGLRLG